MPKCGTQLHPSFSLNNQWPELFESELCEGQLLWGGWTMAVIIVVENPMHLLIKTTTSARSYRLLKMAESHLIYSAICCFYGITLILCIFQQLKYLVVPRLHYAVIGDVSWSFISFNYVSWFKHYHHNNCTNTSVILLVYWKSTLHFRPSIGNYFDYFSPS